MRLVGLLICGAIVYAVATAPNAPSFAPTSERPADPLPARTLVAYAPPDEAATPAIAALPTATPSEPAKPELSSPPPAPASAAPIAVALTRNEDVTPRLTVQRDKVVLRKAPGANAAKLGTVARGEIVSERGRSGAWREIELADGRRGWVNASAFEERPTKEAKREQPNAAPPAPREIEAPSTGVAVATAA